MSYVDGFVLPVPQDKLEAYWEMARNAGAVWMEYGALEYVECAADDVPDGKLTSFPLSVQLEPGETVVFAWVRYASRADRDRILKQVMEDDRLKEIMPADMPFDGKRMFWGGFEEGVRL